MSEFYEIINPAMHRGIEAILEIKKNWAMVNYDEGVLVTL